MKIAILGCGVIGATAAYYLARDGHEVEVIERRDGAALETSFANAGEVSPGYASPWAGPGVPMKAIKWMLMHHSPLVIKPMLDYRMWHWCALMLRNCTEARYRLNKARMVRLAEYSRDCLKQLRADTNISYDERTQGTLQLFRTRKQMDAMAKDIQVLKQYGVPFEVLEQSGYVAHEPALALVKDKFVGALRLPGDETGDCYKFTQQIVQLAKAYGASFRFNADISEILIAGNSIASVMTSSGVVIADRYLLACGSFSSLILKKLGLCIPVYPVKGYSLTLPIDNPTMAPESTIMDETYKVAVTRLGDRIRVGGTAQLSGFDMNLTAARRQTLEYVVSDLFPRGGDVRKAEFWAGLRPMTPDGTPIVGPTPVENLWLATGHGTLGWTMAAGTGKLLSDWIGGRKTDVDTEGLSMARYHRW